jgi:predicted metalloprotease
MKLDGRRESTNVDDRRGKKTVATAGGVGLGGLILYFVLKSLLGVDISPVLEQQQQQVVTNETYEHTPEKDSLAKFSRQILASTEDVWNKVFAQYGADYQEPTLVLFDQAVSTGCGNATSQTGPFYCSADQCLYIDLDFFSEMKNAMGINGDFACAYVIAHEVGHHVQNQLGTLSEKHQEMARLDKAESNKVSVRIELQADFYAGVWGYYESKMFGSLEDGDLEEAINAAQKIGDDYLQRQAGYREVKSDLFTHGTSQQRMRWLKKGLTTGDLRQGDTFSLSYSSL